MFVLGHFLDALAVIIYYALTIYMWVIIARAVLSWVSPDPYNPIVRFLIQVTEPLLAWIRRLVPPIAGLDFSVLIAILLVQIVIQGFLVRTLTQFAMGL